MKKNKTTTEDFIRSVFYAISDRYLNVQQISKLTNLDRGTIGKYLVWMVDLCIIDLKIIRKSKTYRLDQFIRFKISSKPNN